MVNLASGCFNTTKYGKRRWNLPDSTGQHPKTCNISVAGCSRTDAQSDLGEDSIVHRQCWHRHLYVPSNCSWPFSAKSPHPSLESRPETPVSGRKAMSARKLVYGDATLASKPNRA